MSEVQWAAISMACLVVFQHFCLIYTVIDNKSLRRKTALQANKLSYLEMQNFTLRTFNAELQAKLKNENHNCNSNA